MLLDPPPRNGKMKFFMGIIFGCGFACVAAEVYANKQDSSIRLASEKFFDFLVCLVFLFVDNAPYCT